MAALVRAPRIVALVSPGLMEEFFSPEDEDRLRAFAGEGGYLRVDTLAEVPDTSLVQIIVTSWGVPAFDERTLAGLPALRLIAHTGATIRPLVTPAVYERDIIVTQAGAAMARSVAEVSLAFTLALLHRIPQMNDALRHRDGWFSLEESGAQREILGATIAVIGASRTGRAYLEMIRLLGARPLLVDPTVDAGAAAELGSELVTLDEGLNRATIVALHAPSLPATRHMIGERELALMPAGAGLVNTARSWLVDETALLRQLETGRICAAIDVFDEEPLPADSAFRRTPGTLLTPHRAAGTVEGRLRQGRIVADEIDAFLSGRVLEHAIDEAQLKHIA